MGACTCAYVWLAACVYDSYQSSGRVAVRSKSLGVRVAQNSVTLERRELIRDLLHVYMWSRSGAEFEPSSASVWALMVRLQDPSGQNVLAACCEVKGQLGARSEAGAEVASASVDR